MDRVDLLPAANRAERLLLLDVLAGRCTGDVPHESLAAVTPPNLAPFVHFRLRQIFAAEYRQSALLYLRRTAEIRRIYEALQARAVEMIVLKGPVLAATVYPDPAARTMLDVDLLVRELEPAMAALAPLGYRIPERFAGTAMNAGDAPPLRCDVPGAPTLELHALLDSAPDDPAALARAWASVRMVDLGNRLLVPALGVAESFVQVVLHLSRHHRFEGQLRSLLDVDLLLRSAETASLDWSALAEEWERRGIAEWVGLTVTLARLCFDTPVPAVFDRFTPADEALAIAAEQLWIVPEERLSGRVTSLFTKTRPAPLHAHAAPQAVPMPKGARGAWLRARRPLQSMRNVVALFRRGALRPRRVAESIELLEKRERLFVLIESGRAPRS